MCCKVIFAIKKQNLWYFSELLMLMFKFPQTSEAKIHGVFLNLNKHKLFTQCPKVRHTLKGQSCLF